MITRFPGPPFYIHIRRTCFLSLQPLFLKAKRGGSNACYDCRTAMPKYPWKPQCTKTDPLTPGKGEIPDRAVLKRVCKESIEAMDKGKLRQELLNHFNLYFTKLLHNMAPSHKKAGTNEQPSASRVVHPPPRKAQSLAVFNLFAREGERLKELPSSKESQSTRETLLKLCATAGYDAFKLIEDHFLEDQVSYSTMKDLSVVMIGQESLAATVLYLSLVVRNLPAIVEKAFEEEDKERCADLHSFISQLLMLSRFRCQITGTSYPRTWTPMIECVLAALLSMDVDVSALIARSTTDLHRRSSQMVAQVLLHLNHSPSHLLDVLIQLTASYRDALFLEPLYRRILFERLRLPTNADFIKYVYVVREMERILLSVILREEMNSLVQEAYHRTPPNLLVWLQETAPQWLSNAQGKTRTSGTKDIVRFLLEEVDKGDFEELIVLLTSTTKRLEWEGESETEAEDLFFLDKSQDQLPDALPGEDTVIRDWTEDEGDLANEINLADELLAELDQEMGGDQERVAVDEREEGRQVHNQGRDEVLENEEDQEDGGDELMDISIMTSGRRSPELFPSSQEISFEERRALDLELRKKQKDTGCPSTSKVQGKKGNNLSGLKTPQKDGTSSRSLDDKGGGMRKGKSPKTSSSPGGQKVPVRHEAASTPRRKNVRPLSSVSKSVDRVQRAIDESMKELKERPYLHDGVLGENDRRPKSRTKASVPENVSPKKSLGRDRNIEDEDVTVNRKQSNARASDLEESSISPRKRARRTRGKVVDGVRSKEPEAGRVSPFRQQHQRGTLSSTPKIVEGQLDKGASGDGVTLLNGTNRTASETLPWKIDTSGSAMKAEEGYNDVELGVGNVVQSASKRAVKSPKVKSKQGLSITNVDRVKRDNQQVIGEADRTKDKALHSDSESEVFFNLQKSEDRKKQLQVRSGPSSSKAKAQQRYFSPKMLRRTRMREAKWDEVMQAGKDSRNEEPAHTGKLGDNEVVPSSGVDEEADPPSAARLSFPALTHQQSRKRPLGLSRKKAPPKKKIVGESDDGTADIAAPEAGDNSHKLDQRRKTIGGDTVLRRSQRVRVSSTSSVEGSRGDLGEARRKPKQSNMNLRSVRTASK